MNILKTRAWDKVSKCMIENIEAIHFHHDLPINKHRNNNFSHITFWITDNTRAYLYSHDCILMLCTSLKDKNKKLIYDGDIIRCVDGDIISIGYHAGCFGWSKGDCFWTMRNYFLWEKSEIIGNIYKNPELYTQ